MAMKKRYQSIGGRIISEKSGGVRVDYLTGALGSVTCTVDQSQVTSNPHRHAAYGKRITPSVPAQSFQWVGAWGYRKSAVSGLDYVRARDYRSESAEWTSVDTLWPGSSAYQYAFNSPAVFRDTLGLYPDTKCKEMSDCLSKAPSCGGKKSVSHAMMFCVFWQESNFGSAGPPPGGIGSCTKPCFETLQKGGCFKTFKSYDDFVKKATDCEKAQAAFAFIQVVGLSGYGPGPGKDGDYRGPTGTKIKDCEDCITRRVVYQCSKYFDDPPPPLDEICSFCFVTTVHK